MNRNGFHEKIKQGLKRQNTPKYDDELEKLQKEKLLLGSKENKQQGNNQTMKEKNSLEELLYGNNHDMKTFSNFNKEGEDLVERTKGKGNKDTLKRMEKSYKRRKREQKIDKLSNNQDHWEGLQ